MKRESFRFVHALGVLLVSSLLTVLLALPVVSDPDGRLYGDPGDSFGTLAELEHLSRSLQLGRFPLLGGGFQPAEPTPPFGSETRAILGGLGFTQEEVTSLVTGGVTRETGPRR